MRRIFHFSGYSLLALGAFFLFPSSLQATYGDVTTFVGSVTDGDGGQANAGLLDFPDDVASDSAGNLYIADTFDNAIRKVTPAGILSTLAGGSYGLTDGTASSAAFSQPRGVAADASGNVYVADTDNDAIRKIDPSGVVTTLVNSGLNSPYGVSVAGATLFIADTGNNALKSVSTGGGAVATITSSLNDPRKIDATTDGTLVYVADNGSHRVLKVIVSSGAVSVVAGSGTSAYNEGVGASASFENIYGITLASDESSVYVSDDDLYLTDRIRKITLATGATSLFAFDSTQQSMIFPAGLTITGGNLYAAMSGLGIVRRYATSDANDTSIAAGTERFGGREGANPLFGRPHDIVLTADRKTMYAADNNRIRKITLATGVSESVIGSVVDNYRDGIPVGAGASNLDEARFSTISGIVVNAAGTALYVADRWNNRIRKVDLTSSPVRSSLVTGAGRKNSTGETANGYQEGSKCTQEVDRNEALTLQNGCAYFLQPTSLTLDPTETYLYVADTGNNRIRRVKISDGTTTLVAGGAAGYADGTGAAANFNSPFGITISDDGTTLYVADRGNHRIRTVNLATNAVNTLAGAGSAGYQEGIGTKAYFSFPRSLKIGADGKLYVTEAGSHRIRQLDPATGLTKLVAGSGLRGYVDGAQATAEFNNLEGISPDTTENRVYAVDSWNDLIRTIDITGTAPYADPAPTVTKVVPGEVDRDWDKGSGLKVKILGTGFRHGAVTKFYTYTASKTFVVSDKEVVATIPLKRMKPGWYDVTVTNTDGQFGIGEALLALRQDDDSVPEEFFSVAELKGFYGFKKTLRGGFLVANGNVTGDAKEETIAGTGDGMTPVVRILSSTGSALTEFRPYGRKAKTGVRLATCDLDGDGFSEIVTAPGPGAQVLIRVFNGSGKAVIIPKGIKPFKKSFRGGAHVTCGDVTGDGKADILITAGKGGPSDLFIFSSAGQKTKSFRPYGKTFKGGIHLALGDLDGNGTKEILTAPESGKAQVVSWNGTGKKLSNGFFPFAKSFKGGISIAAGDTNADGKDEIIVAPFSKAQPLVKVYQPNGSKSLAQFHAYPRGFTGGVRVSSGDVNGDGTDDIITAPASNFTPSIRTYHQDGTPL